MKRISTLLLSAAMLFGSVGAAQAVEAKFKGQFDFAYGWRSHVNFTKKKGDTDRDFARQRIRPQINFIASENLQGVLMFEIGTQDWGRGGEYGRGAGGALDADGVNIETRRAYIDWIVPDTDLAIRMGIQGLALPSATGFGNPIFNADVGAIVASYQFDETFGITGFWARPFNRYSKATNAENLTTTRKHISDKVDMFGLVGEISGDGWSVSPWVSYARVGAQSGALEYLFDGDYSARTDSYAQIYNRGNGTLSNNDYKWDNKARAASAWMAGLATQFTIVENLEFAFDVMYSGINSLQTSSDSLGGATIKTRGWLIDAKLDYKMDWATAGIFGWWSTGDKERKVRNGKLGRIFALGVDDGFHPTSFGFPGGGALLDDTAVSQTAAGTWGIGAQLADMSFIEDLTHTLRFAYYRGTNDFKVVENDLDAPYAVDNIYLTSKDRVFEINFDHKYQIYENLAAYVELGYINLDLKKNKNTVGKRYDDEDAWKAQVLFQYKF